MEFKLSLLIQECGNDLINYPHPVKSHQHHIKAALKWLCRAQDYSGDGGVSAWFSLIYGWQPSYIETTGYIINTFLECAEYYQLPFLQQRAIKMADFLVKMQHPLGGFRTAVPRRMAESLPTVFNTGQDLLGLTDIYALTQNKKYLKSVIQASDFLLSIQENDGSWLKYTFGGMKHTYHTRVAWGILKVWEITKDKKYLSAAIKNLDWAAEQQLSSGWFRQNQLPSPNPKLPFTHTIAYAIEGFLWSGIILKESKYLTIAQRAALPLANLFIKEGFLPGTLDSNWDSTDRYSCLTGDSQLALIWLELFKLTNNLSYKTAADRMIRFLKATQPTEIGVSPDVQGAIKGSFPIYGDIIRNSGYCRLAYLNWATKFFVDALVASDKIEQGIRK